MRRSSAQRISQSLYSCVLVIYIGADGCSRALLEICKMSVPVLFLAILETARGFEEVSPESIGMKFFAQKATTTLQIG